MTHVLVEVAKSIKNVAENNMETEKKKVLAGFGVMMMRGGKVLLGKRHDDPEKASSALRGEVTWTMPGGKFEFGESFEDGAIREVLEETGIKLINVKVICLNNNKNEHAHFVTVGLFSDEFDGEPKIMEPDEIVEWQWFDLGDLPNPLYFPSGKVLDSYNKNLFYLP